MHSPEMLQDETREEQLVEVNSTGCHHCLCVVLRFICSLCSAIYWFLPFCLCFHSSSRSLCSCRNPALVKIKTDECTFTHFDTTISKPGRVAGRFLTSSSGSPPSCSSSSSFFAPRASGECSSDFLGTSSKEIDAAGIWSKLPMIFLFIVSTSHFLLVTDLL